MNATAKLDCGHSLPFKNWPMPLVPRLGEQLWCYECRDTQTVTEIETDEPGGKESEFIWSE